MDPITISDEMPEGTQSDGIQVLGEWPPMDLPRGATLNDDGSVTLTFDYPAVLKLKAPGASAPARVEEFTELVLRRLTGVDVRKMLAAKNTNAMGLAISTGLGLAKLSLLQNVMNARDESAAYAVLGELLGGVNGSLPANAEETPDGVLMKLYRPAVDEEGTVHAEILFKYLTAAQRRGVVDAPSIVDWGIALSAGVTPKVAKSLVDSMDGADAAGVNQVVLFLCGSGRRTSG